MSRNVPFLVSRRRNEHRRRGSSFIDDLVHRTGVAAGQVELLDPAASVELEETVYATLKEGIRAGTVARRCHLYLDEALSLCRRAFDIWPSDMADILFCRYPDFTVRCNVSIAHGVVDALIAFDGDTITIVASNENEGIVLDVETEVAPERLYEVDVWGTRLLSVVSTTTPARS